MNQERLTNNFKLQINELMESKDDLFCGSFKAYFSTYNNVNLRPDRMIKGCFDKEFARWRNGDKLPRLLAQHYTSEVVGKVTAVYGDDIGAIVEASFLNTTQGKDYYTMLKSGAIDELSFAFYVDKFDYDEEGVRNVLEVSGVDEISIVTWGMDPNTRPIEVNNKDLTIRDAEKILRNGGFSKEHAKTIVSNGFAAIGRDDQESNGRDAHVETLLALTNLNLQLRSQING